MTWETVTVESTHNHGSASSDTPSEGSSTSTENSASSSSSVESLDDFSTCWLSCDSTASYKLAACFAGDFATNIGVEPSSFGLLSDTPLEVSLTSLDVGFHVLGLSEVATPGASDPLSCTLFEDSTLLALS